MSDPGPKFELSRAIEHYLAALSNLYKRDQKTEKLKIIVNSQVRVHEEWDYDNWNGGTYGHALYLTVPQDIYLSLVAYRNSIENSICSDINSLHNVQNEHIHRVFIEMQRGEDRDWRQDSGALASPL